METMVPLQPRRRKKSSAKVNLILSVGLHALALGLGAYWAAHEGMLGHRLRELSVLLVPKENKPPPPKKVEPKLEPKATPPKPATPPPVEQARVPVAPSPVAPPPVAASAPPPVAPAPDAPPPDTLPAFSFDAGPPTPETNAVVAYYKSQIEAAFRSNWDRPEDLDDQRFVAEAEISLDAAGKVLKAEWRSGSGNARWDDSVRKALAATKRVESVPPKGFPPKFVIRFDVIPSTQLVSQ